MGGAERLDRIELACDRARPALRQPIWQRLVARAPTRDPAAALAAFAVFVGKIASTRDFVIGASDGAIVVPLDPAGDVSGDGGSATSARIVALEPSADPARHPLFDVGFGDGDPVGDLHVRVVGAELVLDYDAQLFSDEQARRLARALEHVMRAQPHDRAVGTIALLSAEAAPRSEPS